MAAVESARAWAPSSPPEPESCARLLRDDFTAQVRSSTWVALCGIFGGTPSSSLDAGCITPSSTASSLLASRTCATTPPRTSALNLAEPAEDAYGQVRLLQACVRGYLARKHAAGADISGEVFQADAATDMVRWGPTPKVRVASALARQRRVGLDVSAHVTAVWHGLTREGAPRGVALYATRCYSPPELRTALERGEAGHEWEVVHRFSEWRRLHELLMAHGRREFRERLGAAFPPRLGALAALGIVQRARQHALDAYLAHALDVSHEIGRLPDELCAFLCSSHAQWRLHKPLVLRVASQGATAL